MQNIYAYMDIEMEISMHKWFPPNPISIPLIKKAMNDHNWNQTQKCNGLSPFKPNNLSIHGSSRNKIELVTNIYEDVIKY